MAIWMPINLTNSVAGYIVSAMVLLGITVTGLALMAIAGNNKLGWADLLIVKVTFSIYSGWVTAASILNISLALKSMGM